MSLLGWVGTLAACCTTFAFVPQIVKIRKQGGDDLSYAMLSFYLTGILLWLAYGLVLHAAAVIWANGATAVLVAVAIALKATHPSRAARKRTALQAAAAVSSDVSSSPASSSVALADLAGESKTDSRYSTGVPPAQPAPPPTAVITGAFSFTGKYATRLLLDRGYAVRTLTHHPHRANPFGDRVQVSPYNFDNPAALAATLRGASVLINTYWVRFPRGASTFESAVRNTRTLIDAAKAAGIPRIVHVSIANPSLDSPLAYYRGKAQLEKSVQESGLSYAILRPTVIFGPDDILINNIAWFVRHLPVFGIPGRGHYGIRPIYVEDMAALLVNSAEQHGDAARNAIINAVGPETFTFDELVRLIARQLGHRVRLVHMPMPLAYVSTLVAGWFLGDVVLTWEEYKGLMAGLLATDGPATGETRLSDWLAANRDRVGVRYASEVARHFAPPSGNA